MGFFHWLGGLIDGDDQQAADDAGNDITNDLKSNSPYWQASQVNDDGGILQGAAQLQNANIGVNTSAVDADSDQFNALGSQFNNIATNGGMASAAAQHQAAADLGNTTLGGLKAGSRQADATVLAADNNERNWAAGGATQSRAQVLANQLQKQTWNTAVSHANFEAALAGKGLDNQDQNMAVSLALAAQEAANGAKNAQTSAARQEAATDFSNAMGALKAITSAAGSVTSGIAGMSDAAAGVNGNAATANSTGYTSADDATYSGGTTGSAGYASPSTALGTSFSQSKLASPTMSKYTSPITGDTVDPNIPTTTASWGDWLTNGSSLVS